MSDVEFDSTQSNSQTQPTPQYSHLRWLNINSENEKDVWGRLLFKDVAVRTLGIRKQPTFLLDRPFLEIDLTKECFTAGRASANDYSFSSEHIPEKVLQQTSVIHFKITKDLDNKTSPVYIHDCSTNGTFVNDDKIEAKRILANNDIITVHKPAYIALVFKNQQLEVEPTELPPEIVKNYYIDRILGTGAFGIVYLVHNYRTCNSYAVKCVQQNVMIERNIKKTINEAKILKSLCHPCIIKLYDIFKGNNTVVLLLQLAKGGDLLARINQNQFLSENIAKFFFYQICLGIKYLHNKNITHRDLKPDNILLASNETHTLIKISDFGLSKLVQSNSSLRTACGTQLYSAPEIFHGNDNNATYSDKVDIWSLGVVLYACLSGSLPFKDVSGCLAMEQIKRGQFTFSSVNWRTVSDTPKKLINNLLTVDVARRPSINELIKHKWLDDQQTIKLAHKAMEITNSG